MPQIVTITSTKPDGTEVSVKMKVLRSWQDAGGQQIWLHADGTYGYKNGAPALNVEAFDILPELHRKAALSWWHRKGKAASAAYYQRQLAADAKRAQLQIDDPDAPDTEKEAVLYYTQPADDAGAPLTGPFAYIERFGDRRPDWWGRAQEIVLGDERFIIAADGEALDAVTPDAPPAPPAAPDAPDATPDPAASVVEEERQRLLAALKDSGNYMPPNTGLEKLQAKVLELGLDLAGADAPVEAAPQEF